MDDFETKMTKAGLQWSMEVFDKTTARFLDGPTVPYYGIIYRIKDINGVIKELRGYTHQPQQTCLYVANLDAQFVEKEEATKAVLETLKTGEKIGTLSDETVKSQTGLVSTEGKK